ncbi:ABC transporter permease subunit [Ensifer adhaerens]|uniref:ABC transporter permease subunit n=1 Tax=Ensifer adhaerens TaxID=106592 RepID=UPI00109E2F34|nr:ABC transporter permease [Ensifer adhaerens]MDF8357603.1 ABC transporter permease [Ensifer adhaerens]THA57091.1 ABC transporter permease [Ensifer adhaerens]
MLKLINGPQTLGTGRRFWSSFVAVLLAALAFPLFAEPYDVGNFAYFMVWLFMALGLCVMWGYAGIMSFGQTFFFGIAGYAYGVIAINLGGRGFTTFEALVLGVVISVIVAAILGYFMIYGRVGGVFFGIVTLAATLVLAFFLSQTAGPEWAIGKARLNGFNGMTGMKSLNITYGDIKIYFEGINLYYLMIAVLVVVYLGLRILLNSKFGNVIVAIREDEQRAELLGYDVRKYRLITFCIGSGLAGLSGALYTSWGQFITPTTIGLPAAAMPIVWVAFSGRQDITATLVGSFFFLFVYQLITIYSQQAALIITGVILLVTVMYVPEGFVIGFVKKIGLLNRRQRQESTAVLGAPAGDRAHG